jgi:hypothetical protein
MCEPYVEIRAVREIEGHVEWCDEDEAGMFAVYLGVPGDFEWRADFARYADALQYATLLSPEGDIKDWVR